VRNSLRYRKIRTKVIGHSKCPRGFFCQPTDESWRRVAKNGVLVFDVNARYTPTMSGDSEPG
jgi:hypothetical protein